MFSPWCQVLEQCSFCIVLKPNHMQVETSDRWRCSSCCHCLHFLQKKKKKKKKKSKGLHSQIQTFAAAESISVTSGMFQPKLGECIVFADCKRCQQLQAMNDADVWHIFLHSFKVVMSLTFYDEVSAESDKILFHRGCQTFLRWNAHTRCESSLNGIFQHVTIEVLNDWLDVRKSLFYHHLTDVCLC